MRRPRRSACDRRGQTNCLADPLVDFGPVAGFTVGALLWSSWQNVAVLNDSRSSFSAARELLAVPSHPSLSKGNSISCAALIEIVLPSSFLAPTLARRAFGPRVSFRVRCLRPALDCRKVLLHSLGS